MSNEIMNTPSFISTAPAITADLSEKLREAYEQSFNNIGGNGGLRILKVGKSQFSIIDNGLREDLPNGVVGVFLGASPYNHALWYEKSYSSGQEPSAPDLCWLMKDDTFPEALPAKFRKKVERDGHARWGFQIKRRVAMAFMRNDSDGNSFLDLERPVAIDVPSMSLFGKDDQYRGLYKFSGLRNICDKLSRGGCQIFPYMFLMQLVIDESVPVSGVFWFKPYTPGNQPAFLDSDTIRAVYETSQSEAVRHLLTVREKLTYGVNAGSQSVAASDTYKPAVATPVSSAEANTLLQQAQKALNDGQSAQAGDKSVDDILDGLSSALG